MSTRELPDCLYCGTTIPGHPVTFLGESYCSVVCRDEDSIESMRARIERRQGPPLDHRSLLVRRGLLQA